MNKLKVILSTGLFVYALPLIASAQVGGTQVPEVGDPDLENVKTLSGSLGDVIDILIPVAAALALLFFFYGLATYILKAGDEEGKKKGREIMIQGLIALFIIAAIFGLIEFIAGAFGVGTGGELVPPSVDTSS